MSIILVFCSPSLPFNYLFQPLRHARYSFVYIISWCWPYCLLYHTNKLVPCLVCNLFLLDLGLDSLPRNIKNVLDRIKVGRPWWNFLHQNAETCHGRLWLSRCLRWVIIHDKYFPLIFSFSRCFEQDEKVTLDKSSKIRIRIISRTVLPKQFLARMQSQPLNEVASTSKMFTSLCCYC